MVTAVAVVFVLVYVGMMAGKLPWLALDRTGIALVGGIAVVVVGAVPVEHAFTSADIHTLLLLFAMMVIAGHMRLAGFYTRVARKLFSLSLSPPALLALVVVIAGVLSAVLTNDIVCFAMAPVLIEGCARRKLAPVPFLLALACAANAGSAATLIGNPQNIIVGESLNLSFGSYLVDASVPVLIALIATWAFIALRFRGRFVNEAESVELELDAPAFAAWRSAKGLIVVAVLVVVFLFFRDVPRGGAALVGAGALLLSRRVSSRDLLGLVDWSLLVLFIGLFLVNEAFQRAGLTAVTLDALRSWGLDPGHPAVLFVLGAVLSNVVSNVPATMLLLPSASHPAAGAILALSTTFAGNLVIVGSLANIIVVGAARAHGVDIDYRAHAKTGVPVTLVSLAAAAGWLALRAVW